MLPWTSDSLSSSCLIVSFLCQGRFWLPFGSRFQRKLIRTWEEACRIRRKAHLVWSHVLTVAKQMHMGNSHAGPESNSTVIPSKCCSETYCLQQCRLSIAIMAHSHCPNSSTDCFVTQIYNYYSQIQRLSSITFSFSTDFPQWFSPYGNYPWNEQEHSTGSHLVFLILSLYLCLDNDL